MISAQLREIPHFEYRAINQIIDAHQAEFGKGLRAVVAFGSLITHSDTFDIELLEVVDGYSGVRVAEFGSTAVLPLRGKLRLFFLSTSDFEDMDLVSDAEKRAWVQELLTRVRTGYEIIYQYPAGFAERVLHLSGWRTVPEAGPHEMLNPLTFAKESRKKPD